MQHIFLNLTVPTIYSKVSKGELPVMKRSKRLYFSSTELMEYLKEGRKMSNSEIEQQAETYLSNNKKRVEVMENTSNNPLHKRQGEDTDFNTQLITIFQYLQDHIATASMVSEATGVPQKNICRYKRDLECSGRLWEIKKDYCEKTGFKAWYITTNPEFSELSDQLSLFLKLWSILLR